MISVCFSTVFTRSPNGEIALADITGDETYHKFFVEITKTGTVQNKNLTMYV